MQPKIEVIGDVNKCLQYIKWAKQQWSLREGQWQKQLDTCLVFFKRQGDSGYILFLSKDFRFVGAIDKKLVTITAPEDGTGILEFSPRLDYGNIFITDNDSITYSISNEGIYEEGSIINMSLPDKPIILVLNALGELYSVYEGFIYKGTQTLNLEKTLNPSEVFKQPYNLTPNTILSIDVDLSFSDDNKIILTNKNKSTTGTTPFNLIRVGGFSPKLVGSYTEVGENLQYLFPIDGQNTLNKINVNQTSIYSLSGDSDAGQVTITVPTYRFCLNEWRVVFTDQTSCAVTPLEGVYYKFVDRKTYYKIRLVRTPIPTTVSPIYSASAFFGLFTHVEQLEPCGFGGYTWIARGFGYTPTGGTTYYVEYGGYIHRTSYSFSSSNRCRLGSATYGVSGPTNGDKVFTALSNSSTSCPGWCVSTSYGQQSFATYNMLYDAGARCWDYPSDSYMIGLTDAEGTPVELPSEDGYYVKVYSVEEWSCE